MKKIIAVLVAAVLMLSGISAFAALTPAEEGAIYRALINAGFNNPDFFVRHFDSIAALTTDELAALDTYFANIDAAVKVAVTDVDVNLAASQKVAIFSNFNAIAKILKVSYKIYVEVPTSFVYESAGEGDQDYDFDVYIDGTEMVYMPVNVIINKGLEVALDEEIEARFNAAVEAWIADEDNEDWEDDFFGMLWYDMYDLRIEIAFSCEENGVCVTPSGYLASAGLYVGAFEVTGRDDFFAAKSGIRSWFANFQKVVKAVAAYKPAAAAPAPTTGDRLPDTATSYGNLVVLGVVMMVVAAAAVIGVKKVVRA